MACRVVGCTKPNRGSSDWCSTHYDRVRRHGNPEYTTRCPPTRDLWTKLRWHGWTVTDSGCWEWGGRRDQYGYGIVKHLGSHQRTHRLVFEDRVAIIPEGYVVRHKCDNPPCMNPDHLETGTQAENIQDAVDRQRSGAPRKLTWEQVTYVREQVASGRSQSSLERELGLGGGIVCRIVNYQTYKRPLIGDVT